MKKSLTLAIAMALGVTATAYAANPFSDVPQGHWAYGSVGKLVAEGVVEGYPEGNFDGNKLMTRYEMAQIVAKAMAKGANVDKLAAEFAEELDTLGIRVAKLEKAVDAVKITGEARYHYADMDIEQFDTESNDFYISGKSGNTHQLRSRIWIEGAINDDWSYTGMIQNIQDFDNETGDEDVKFKRAYVEGRIGGLDVLAGRYNAFLVNGNLYDEHADGIEVSYGKDVKFTGFYMKPTEQNSTFLYLGLDNMEVDDSNILGAVGFNLEYGKAWGAKVDANIGVVKTTAGYTVFQDGELGLGLSGTGNGNFVSYIVPFAKQDDNKIWNVGVAFDLAKDLKLTADYLKSDIDGVSYEGTEVFFDDDDGYIIGLNYKGAKANEPGSYGIYANYYDQARSTVIAHTMNGFYGNNGFKGYMVGVNYAFAKNIVAAIEWYDLESKGLAGSIPKQDMETLWAQLVFTF